MNERQSALLDKDLIQSRDRWREELFSFPTNRVGRWLLIAAALVAFVGLQTNFAQPIHGVMNAVFIAVIVVSAIRLVAFVLILVFAFFKKSREQRTTGID